MAEYDERIRRLHPVPNRSELEQLSPEELAQAMEQALDDMTEDTYDQAVIDAYLDALDAKAPMPEAPDVEESYQQFQEMLSQALPSEESPRPRRRGRVLRMTLRVTLAAVFLFGCLVAAQASGVDVFGAVARWTDETFHFEVQEDQTTSDWYAPYQEQLESVGLDSTFMPTWIPEGYTVGNVEVDDFSDWVEIYVPFNNTDGSTIHYLISVHENPSDIGSRFFEKDNRPVQEYQISDKTVYLFHNLDLMTAVCQYETVIYSLSGDLSEDMVLKFFSSISFISSTT